MPYKSKAQMRAFFAKEDRGELPKGTAERWAKHTKNIEDLPEKKEAMLKSASLLAAVLVQNQIKRAQLADQYGFNTDQDAAWQQQVQSSLPPAMMEQPQQDAAWQQQVQSSLPAPMLTPEQQDAAWQQQVSQAQAMPAQETIPQSAFTARPAAAPPVAAPIQPAAPPALPATPPSPAVASTQPAARGT
jgi:hypothetical protein